MLDKMKMRWFDGRTCPGLPLLACGMLAMAVPDALGDEILLHGGGKLEGSIVEATGNILVIRRPAGGVQQVVRRLVAGISVPLEDGSAISGELVSWDDGTHRIRTGDGVVGIRAGQILGGKVVTAEGDGTRSSETKAGLPASLNSPAQRQSYVPPPIYILRNGATLVGRAIGFQDPLLTVRRATGGQRTLRVGDIRQVVIRDSHGGSLAGELIDWSEGIFELRVDEQLIRVADGAIIGEADGGSDIGGPLEALPKKAGHRVDDEVAIAAVAPATTDQTNDPTSAASGGEKIIMSASAEPTNEQDGAVVFTLQLSRPAPQAIVVIYSILEETADRDDIGKGSGVITIQAGADTAEVRIPLVDDEVQEGSESFRLFLSSDPMLIELASNRIVALIEDND